MSFVDSGDNAEAHVVMYKAQAAEGDQQQAAEGDEWLTRLVHTIINEELAGIVSGGTETRKVAMTATMMKQEDVLAERERLAVAKVAGSDELTIASARMEVWLENEELRRRYYELQQTSPAAPVAMQQGEPVVKGADTIAKHEAAVSELRKAHPDRSPAALRTMAWDLHPELRDAYNRALGY